MRGIWKEWVAGIDKPSFKKKDLPKNFYRVPRLAFDIMNV